MGGHDHLPQIMHIGFFVFTEWKNYNKCPAFEISIWKDVFLKHLFWSFQCSIVDVEGIIFLTYQGTFLKAQNVLHDMIN